MKELTARKISLAVLSAQGALYIAVSLMMIALETPYAGDEHFEFGPLGSNLLIAVIPIAGLILLSFKFNIVYFVTMCLHFLATLFGALVLINETLGNYHDVVLSEFLGCVAVVIFAILMLLPDRLKIISSGLSFCLPASSASSTYGRMPSSLSLPDDKNSAQYNITFRRSGNSSADCECLFASNICEKGQ